MDRAIQLALSLCFESLCDRDAHCFIYVNTFLLRIYDVKMTLMTVAASYFIYQLSIMSDCVEQNTLENGAGFSRK